VYDSIFKSEDGVFESFVNYADGRSYTVKHVKKFRDYIEDKYGDWDKFLRLKRDEKDVIFLKYKHGSESHSVNIGLDIHDRNILKQVSPEELAEGGHYYSRKVFDDYCYEVKKEIGLVPSAPSEEQKGMTALVKKVFGGKQLL
jgi:hypothetical protein